jgi:hypothetical protein
MKKKRIGTSTKAKGATTRQISGWKVQLVTNKTLYVRNVARREVGEKKGSRHDKGKFILESFIKDERKVNLIKS